MNVSVGVGVAPLVLRSDGFLSMSAREPRHRTRRRTDWRRNFSSFWYLAGLDAFAISLRDVVAAFVGSLIFLAVLWFVTELAEEIAPRLDAGSPVTATVSKVEQFQVDGDQQLLGVRLSLVPYRLKHRQSKKQKLQELPEQSFLPGSISNTGRLQSWFSWLKARS